MTVSDKGSSLLQLAAKGCVVPDVLNQGKGSIKRGRFLSSKLDRWLDGFAKKKQAENLIEASRNWALVKVWKKENVLNIPKEFGSILPKKSQFETKNYWNQIFELSIQ